MPRVTFARPINPIDVNTGTLMLYNADSYKYVLGTVNVAADGLSATFKPTYPLLPNTYYSVLMSGGPYDMDGNYLYGYYGYFTTGVVAAVVPPNVASVFPATGTPGVPVNAHVVVHFNEPIDPLTYNAIQVTPTGGGAPIAGTNSLGSDQMTLTFTPSAPLTSSTPYTVQVSGYADLSENVGATFTGTFTTSTASDTGLSLVSSTPANGATGVATNTTITLNFNDPIDPATVNSSTLSVMIGWNSNATLAGSYQVTGNQVIFTPDSPFPVNMTIYVGNCNGPYDWAGNPLYAGCYPVQFFSFTTGSTAIAPSAPLQVMAFTPSSGATGVGLRAPVVATFNHSINPSTVNASDFAMFAGDSQSPMCTSYSRSQDSATLMFNCYPLPASTTMTAYLDTGIQDWTGNTLATNFISQFATTQSDSSTNGTVISTRPGYAASGINANQPITLYSNLPINSATASGGIQVAQNNVAVSGSVAVLDNGYTLEFTPSSPWTAGALIQWWTTNNLTTTNGTYINAASGYFFAAASTATSVPALQVASPSIYSAIALNSFFDFQFNTPLNPATVNSTSIYLYDGSTTQNVAGTYSMPQPNVVRIQPSANLGVNHYLYLYFTSSLQSATSVPASGGYQGYYYTGTSTDATTPTVVSAVPYNGAQNVGVNVAPGVVFSKTIDAVSVNSSTFQVTNGGTPLVGNYWFNSNDTRVEFVPNAPLPPSTNLVMTLNGVLDQVGNPIFFTSSFTTGPGPDFTPPTVVWTSVTSNESIPTNSSIRIQFSESMDVTTFGPSNFYISDALLGTYIPTTLSWSADQSLAYLAPTSPLSAGRQYYFYASGGTDLAGNQVSGVSFYFYAEFASSSSAPTVINFNPLSGATGLGTNTIVEAQFSAAIDPNTVGGVTLSAGGTTVPTTPLLSAGNTVLQLVPQSPLAPKITYTMTIAGVKDPAGNTVAIVSNSFTTGATYDIYMTYATAINYDPPYNSTVGTNVVPKFVFNKPLNPITVSNNTFRMYLYDTGQFIPLTVTPSSNGLEVTMQPQIPLLPNTRYYFQACCGFQDQDGNNGNGVTVYFNTSGGAVITGPTVTVSPFNGATGIPLNAVVIASVSAPIDPISWTQSSIQLLNGSIPLAGTVSMPNTQTLVFTPSSFLSAGATYTVNVSGFTDTNGNAVATSPSTFTVGSVAAVGGLTFTSSNITWGATGVSATQQIILTFSQILLPSTVNSSTLKVMDGWNGYNGLAGTYAVSGNQVTFTPTSPYPAGANITVGECGGPTDILGEVFQNGNCYPQQLVNFTVTTGSPDTTPLTVLSVNPANGATYVALDLPISVTFNKSINPGTTGSYNTQLYAGQSMQDNGSVTLSADGRTMTFNTGALYNGTSYTIALPAAIGGIGGVTDFSGNGLASTFTSTFTTTTDPATGNGYLQAVRPTWGSTGVPTDSLLTLYLTRPVNAATLPGNLTVTVNGQLYAGSVTSTASGYEVQFTPTVAFPNGAVVQWFFSGNVMDVYGNTFQGNSGYFFTVAAGNPATDSPQIVAVSPASGSTNVPTNAYVDIEYSLPINGATLSGNVNFYYGGVVVGTITQPSPNIVRVTPNPAFSPSTANYFCANTSIQGTNGVAAQGGCWTTYFTTTSTSDTTSGTVKIGPADSSVNVGTNAYIRLQFSKPVDVTSINATTVQITVGPVAIPGTWSYTYSSGNAMGANFSPVNPLPPSSTIQVSASGLLDYAGNTFALANAQFTTEALPDFSAASVSLDFPSSQTGIATNALFTCRYSKAIDPSSITSSGLYIYDYTHSAYVPVGYTFSSDLMAVTMTPTAPLAANAEFGYACYYAIDLTGNAAQNGFVYFYTGSGPSSAGPTLVQANPPNLSTNVPINTNNGPWNSTSLGLLFSEPVAGNSLGNITLTPNGGSPLAIAVYQQMGNTEVAVQLPSALQPNTTYTFSITGVTDYNGNPITPVTSTFSTGSSFDWTNPVITAVTPLNLAISVNDATPGLSVTFSEAMNPILIDSNHIYLRTHNTLTTVTTTITISLDYKTVTLAPTASLAAATIYDLIYWPNTWWLADIAGNVSYSYGVLSTFTTQ